MKQLCLAHQAIHTSQHRDKPVSGNIIFFSLTDMFVLHLWEKNQKQMMEWKPFPYRYAADFQFPFVENPSPSTPVEHTQSNSQWVPTDWNALSSDNEGQRKEASSANWSNGSTLQVAEYQIIQAPQPTASTWKGKKQKPLFVSQGFAGIKHSSPSWQTQTLTRIRGQPVSSSGCPQGMAYFKPACKHLPAYVLYFHGRII